MASENSYSKMPLWQWLVIYGLIGVVVYGFIYYFFFTNKNSNSYGSMATNAVLTPSPSVTLTGDSPTPETLQNQNNVILSVDGFSPQTLTVQAGQKVTWTNNSGSTATVNSAVHPTHLVYPPLNLGDLPDGGTVSLIFNSPGTYSYHNHLNPSQYGTIIVK